ncbi:AMP-dependent synthetase and ligase, partial [Periconia macrospinosa]
MLAVLKAGGAFAPLDPEHPASRHEEIFRQTRARVVLASDQHSMLCRGNNHTLMTISETSINQLLPRDASKRREMQIKAQPNNTAYVIFTSGSTGTPKGVVIEHQAISTSCLGHGKAFGFAQDTRAFQFSAYTFDACIPEIITTLLYG